MDCQETIGGMDMDALLGNARLKSVLAAAFAADRFSHCYLLAGPEGSGKHTLARILAAAMECTAGAKRPCGVCLQCRKVLDGVHPDVITVDDPDKKTVTVELIRKARADVYIKPNEGRRKVYLIPRAADMNAAAQNALLKVIEEPPDYAAFLLLTDGAERLLPTIRSRSVPLLLTPLSAGGPRGAVGRAGRAGKAPSRPGSRRTGSRLGPLGGLAGAGAPAAGGGGEPGAGDPELRRLLCPPGSAGPHGAAGSLGAAEAGAADPPFPAVDRASEPGPGRPRRTARPLGGRRARRPQPHLRRKPESPTQSAKGDGAAERQRQPRRRLRRRG